MPAFTIFQDKVTPSFIFDMNTVGRISRTANFPNDYLTEYASHSTKKRPAISQGCACLPDRNQLRRLFPHIMPSGRLLTAALLSLLFQHLPDTMSCTRFSFLFLYILFSPQPCPHIEAENRKSGSREYLLLHWLFDSAEKKENEEWLSS